MGTVIREFIRRMVKGRSIEMLVTSGDKVQCFVSLDSELQALSLRRVGKKDAKRRCVLLNQVNQICVGDDLPAEIAIDFPVVYLSVSLVLDKGRAIGFHVED